MPEQTVVMPTITGMPAFVVKAMLIPSTVLGMPRTPIIPPTGGASIAAE